MTYGPTTTTSLKSIDLYFSLCEDTKLKEKWEEMLATYVKWLTLHELGHYFYYIKDTKTELFQTLCWKQETSFCTADDFITEYAQTDPYEDYAEHFAYWYLTTIEKQVPLRKPANPNTERFQAKMNYFKDVFTS